MGPRSGEELGENSGGEGWGKGNGAGEDCRYGWVLEIRELGLEICGLGGVSES